MLRLFILFPAMLLSLSSQAKDSQNHDFGYTWKECESQAWGGSTFPFDENQEVKPNCTPDAFYTWTEMKWIRYDLKSYEEKNILLNIGPGGILGWRTPVGTYGYGSVLLKVKLRSNVRFIPVIAKKPIAEERRCSYWKKQLGDEIHNVVFAVYLESFPGYHEYLLCTDGPVHSWSFGTERNREEILRDKTWMENQERGSYDVIFPKNLKVLWIESNGGKKKFDGGEWKVQKLIQNLSLLDQLIAEGKGKVIFADNVEPSLDDHFSTKTPSYFNPYSER